MSRKLLLNNIHVEGIHTYDVYRKTGGYAAVEKALKLKNLDSAVVEEQVFQLE